MSLFQKRRKEEDAGMSLQRIRGCRHIGHIVALAHLMNGATPETIPFSNHGGFSFFQLENL
jgi:hypothetical protein